MNRIVTVQEIGQLKDIGKSPSECKINPIINQAQEVDLRNYLGTSFYFELLSNLTNPTYQALLSGGNFTLKNVTPEITYHQEGIKAMLADLFYAKYLLQINTNITPFGATIKHSTDSEPADRNALKDIAQIHLEMAASKWEIIQLYIKDNVDLFPSFNTNNAGCLSNSTSERKLKFRKI